MRNIFLSLRAVFMALMLVSGMVAYAQVAANGVVTDAANGEPIIGASILEIGTTNGTITDFDGNFSLNVKPGAKLSISYMGYKTVELAAGPNMNVRLGEDSELLDEVVVVGYGVVKKNDATGSVTAIKPDDMNKGLQTSATDMLSGKIAGVNVTTSGGAPGAGATIRIRGGSSLSASNDPLIVIDGLAMDNDGIKGVSNPLSLVNPNDIETFTVLKDASATAIYGSRASNGVIIITTKKGSQGQKLKVSYNGSVSASVLTNTMRVMNAGELKNFVLNELGKTGQIAGTPDGNTYENQFGSAETDWQKEIYRTAISTDHNINLTGGTKHMPYRFSVGYTLGNGIVKTNQMQRVTASMNLSPSFLDNHLSFNLNAKGMYIYNRYADGIQGAALDMDPTQSVYSDAPGMDGFAGYYQRVTKGDFNDAEGQNPGDKWYYTNNSQSSYNPVAQLNLKRNIAHSGQFVGNLEGDYKIHGFEDLRLHANFGADYSYGKQTLESDPRAFNDHYYGRYGFEEEKKYNLLFNAYAQYYKDFNEKHHFDAMVGYEWQHFYRDGQYDYYGMYPSTSLKTSDAGEPLAGTKYSPSQLKWATESYLVSFFGRVNYIALNRYMITATVRGDGSSRFAKKNRWGVFPSVALGWKIKEEAFLKDVNWLSDLKLRLGYGITGQQNISQGDYPYMPTYTNSKEYAWSTLGELAAGYVPAEGMVEGVDYVSDGQYIYYRTYRPNVYNPDITWEKTTTYNAGIDYGFLNGRITGSIDYYYRITDDLINEVDIPAGTNFKTRVIKNVGSLRNQGLEFAINAVAIDNKRLKWDLGFNLTYNDNKITKLTTSDEEDYFIADGGVSNGKYVKAHAVGHAAGSFYVYQTGRDADGNLGIVDQNRDGEINEKDKIYFHSPDAPVTMGLTSKWQFYGFDLGISFRAAIGNYVYNKVLADNLQNVTGATVYDSKCGGYHNVLWEGYNAYYKDGVHRADFLEPDLLDYFVQNASFLRCDNITLGYSWTKPNNVVSNARLYCTVSNPFVITAYKGMDPEVPGGIDSNIYPRSLSIVVGTSINF